MKKNINILFVTIVLLLQIACTDSWLDVTPAKRLDINYWTMEQDALDALTGAYKVMQTDQNRRNLDHLWQIGDCMSDDASKGGGSNTDQYWIYLFQTFNASLTDSENLLKFWSIIYQGARHTNMVIENVPHMDAKLFSKNDLQNRIVAEAKFLRAFYYFIGINIFGENIPLVLETMNAANESSAEVPFARPNAVAGEIYDQIEKDLKEAVDFLPWSYGSSSEIGRATKGAALGLWAKVSVWRQKWQQAYDLSTQVINSGTYNLMAVKYENLWDCDNEFNACSVWEIAFGTTGTGQPVTGNNGNIFMHPRNSSWGYGFNFPSLDLWDAYEEGDPRRKATIIKYGDTIRKGTPDQIIFKMALDPATSRYYAFDSSGKKITGNALTLNKRGFDHTGNEANLDSLINYKYYLPRRFCPNEYGLPNAQGETNVRYLQIAEIYLFRAEAGYHLGKFAECKQDLLAVRHRAKLSLPNPNDQTILPDSKITSLSGESLLNAVYQERRVELAMEGHRYFDLMRRNLDDAKLILDSYLANEKKFILDGVKTRFDKKYKNLPIPNSEILKSSGVMKQNPGW